MVYTVTWDVPDNRDLHHVVYIDYNNLHTPSIMDCNCNN